MDEMNEKKIRWNIPKAMACVYQGLDDSKLKIKKTKPYTTAMENLKTLYNLTQIQTWLLCIICERYFEDDAGKRYCHILDPADGYPAENGLVSVTVIGDSGVRCDALSTALYVEGTEQAAAHWKRCSDFEMILVTDDGCVMVSEGIADRFQSDGTMPVEVMHREE